MSSIPPETGNQYHGQSRTWDVKAGDLMKRVIIEEDVIQKLIDDLAALRSYINKKYTEYKEAGKVKDNWLEKAMKSCSRQSL